MVEANSFTVVAASVLRFHKVEAALVLVRGLEHVRMGKKSLFVGGYPILANLLKKSPENYYNFLFEPCIKNAMALDSLGADRKLRDLLNLFKESGFGFTTVTEGNQSSLVGLSDVIALYEDGSIETDLLVKDVASSKFSVRRRTALNDAVARMFERRIRRVFIDGTRAFVSDREIISLITSPRKLEAARASPSALLEGTIEDAGPIDAEEVGDDTSLQDAARLVTQSQGSAVICERGVISPWDSCEAACDEAIGPQRITKLNGR